MIFLFLISSAVSRKGIDDCSSHSHPEAPAGLVWNIVNLMFSWILLMSSRNPCSLSRDPVKTKKEVLKESLHQPDREHALPMRGGGLEDELVHGGH